MKKSVLAFVCAFVLAFDLTAALKLHPTIGDNMVLSAECWSIAGKADPGAKIVISANGQKFTVTADGEGRFLFRKKMSVIAEPFTLTVSDGKEKIEVKNVLSGLVLLAGGQSNMEVPVKEALNPEAEAAAANHPLIREFKVRHVESFTPQESLPGKWTVVTPETAPRIGAISLYTARLLQKELNGIPVGIINNSYSASPQQAWIPLEKVREIAPGLAKSYDKFKHMGDAGVIAYREKLAQSLVISDSGDKGSARGWYKADFDDSAWKDIKIPSVLENVFGEKDGAFWFRKTVDLPAGYAGKDLLLELGVVDDYDVTHFNGEIVGKTGLETPDTWKVKRFYKIPGKLVKAGKNVIAIRCFDSGHAGGLFDKPVNLQCDGKIIADLTGIWKTEAETIIEPVKWHPDYLTLVKFYRFASVLYNAMLYPLKGCYADAILWYQGESNAGSKTYLPMLRSCIDETRAIVNEKAPFLLVQLAAYQKEQRDPNQCGSWPVTRNDQARVRDMAGVYMIPTIDIGDARNIHPLNKQEAGRRLAASLLQNVYKLKSYAGQADYPEITAAKLSADGKYIELTLKHGAGLKTTDGKMPQTFAVSAPAKRVKYVMKQNFMWADAAIKGDKIIVTIPEKLIGNAHTVRYGWMMNPPVNTVNEKGLPLLPGSFTIEK